MWLFGVVLKEQCKEMPASDSKHGCYLKAKNGLASSFHTELITVFKAQDMHLNSVLALRWWNKLPFDVQTFESLLFQL